MITDLVGLTLTSVVYDKERERITFTSDSGRVFLMYHDQDCCESVYVESIVGDLSDLLNTPIILSEDVSNEAPKKTDNREYDSYTWTFYRFRTIKGDVDIRWFGTSNGYYSEEVSFGEITPIGREAK